MIKANELRVGNIIEQYGKHVIVDGIDKKHRKDNDYYIRVKEDKEIGYWFNQFKPIPITEDLLLKCGFELKGIIFRINNGFANQFDVNYSLSRNIYYYDWSKYGIYNEVELKYLHHLQNLYFALTNEELQINL